MYEAALRAHRHSPQDRKGNGYSTPRNARAISATYGRKIESFFSDAADATHEPASTRNSVRGSKRPPTECGSGAIPVLLVAALLAHVDQVAIYEHGTFKPALTTELAERLARNPGHFAISHVASQDGARREFVDAATERFELACHARGSIPGVLTIVGHLVRFAGSLPAYTRQTTRLSQEATELRRVLLTATEPDQLLFVAIPEALGFAAIAASADRDEKEVRDLAAGLADAVEELDRAYPALIRQITDELEQATLAQPDRLREDLANRAARLEGVLAPRLRSLFEALRADSLAEQEWAEYVAMVVTGSAPNSWTDEHADSYSAQIAELGAALRRLEALHFQRAAEQHDGFEPIRVTTTRPDGKESALIVGVAEKHAAAVEEAMNAAVDKLAEAIGSRHQAQAALLATLAGQIVPAAPEPDIEPKYDTRKPARKSRRSKHA